MNYLPVPVFNEQLYNSCAALMYGCILSIVKDRNRADEIFPPAFIKMQQELSGSSVLPEKLWIIKFAVKQAFLSMKENSANTAVFSLKKALTLHRSLSAEIVYNGNEQSV